MKPFILAIVGQTATGKSALGVTLAQKYQGEIVSADSMQVYRGLEIATAQPTEEEKDGIPHHLMGFLRVDETFSVAEYAALAQEKIEEIRKRGKLPILVGGTGLYLDSVLSNLSFSEQADAGEMQKIEMLAQNESKQQIWQRLFAVDPAYAKTLHPNNQKRIIRGLALSKSTGLTRAQRVEKSLAQGTKYAFLSVGLRYREKEILWQRINQRVDGMVKRGLVSEIEQLYRNETVGKTASQAIGYKELIPYFEGNILLEEALEQVKLHTRQYAKRQMTWMRKNQDIIWNDLAQDAKREEICEKVQILLEKTLDL